MTRKKRALLAAEPGGKTCGSISAVRSDATPAQPLPTCANCGSNLIAPAPSPARDEVRDAVRLGICVWCGSALVRDDDAPHLWRCQRSIAGKCVARGYWYILDDDLDYVPFSAALGAVAEVREAAERLREQFAGHGPLTPFGQAAWDLLSALAAKPSARGGDRGEATLPACPVCGLAAKTEEHSFADPKHRFLRRCIRSRFVSFHNVTAYGRTQAEADARWRRMAGGKK